MTLYDVIVVGSGPAGTFAAHTLRGRNVLMLDVGYRPPETKGLDGSLFRLRQKEEDLFESLIGEEFECLNNIYKKKVSLKLKSPSTSYIIKDWEKLSPVASDNFEG